MPPVVDLSAIEHALYACPKARARLVRDYGLESDPVSPSALSQGLVAALGQAPREKPLDVNLPDNEVYRAAVLALASNQRSWSVFLEDEPRLRELLRGYRPKAVADALVSGELAPDEIRPFVPGLTSGADTRAMLAWADLLSEAGGYYGNLVNAARAVDRAGVGNEERMPCVAVLLGAPPSDPRLGRVLPGLRRPRTLPTWKAPGMGPTLASEFLRNLGWSGFKPDRHIQRLFGAWFPDVVESCRGRAQELGQTMGSRRREVVTFFTFCLVGQSVTPPGRTFSEVDNLVWALGSYVEQKGRESSRIYRARRPG